MCGHPPQDIEKVIAKHSPHVAKLEREQGQEAARAHVQRAAQYPQALYDKQSSYVPSNWQDYARDCDKRALERYDAGRDRHSIEEIGQSAKREVMEQRQQEQRQREREQQSHQVTRSITR